MGYSLLMKMDATARPAHAEEPAVVVHAPASSDHHNVPDQHKNTTASHDSKKPCHKQHREATSDSASTSGTDDQRTRHRGSGRIARKGAGHTRRQRLPMPLMYGFPQMMQPPGCDDSEAVALAWRGMQQPATQPQQPLLPFPPGHNSAYMAYSHRQYEGSAVAPPQLGFVQPPATAQGPVLCVPTFAPPGLLGPAAAPLLPPLPLPPLHPDALLQHQMEGMQLQPMQPPGMQPQQWRQQQLGWAQAGAAEAFPAGFSHQPPAHQQPGYSPAWPPGGAVPVAVIAQVLEGSEAAAAAAVPDRFPPPQHYGQHAAQAQAGASPGGVLQLDSSRVRDDAEGPHVPSLLGSGPPRWAVAATVEGHGQQHQHRHNQQVQHQQGLYDPQQPSAVGHGLATDGGGGWGREQGGGGGDEAVSWQQQQQLRGRPAGALPRQDWGQGQGDAAAPSSAPWQPAYPAPLQAANFTQQQAGPRPEAPQQLQASRAEQRVGFGGGRGDRHGQSQEQAQAAALGYEPPSRAGQQQGRWQGSAHWVAPAAEGACGSLGPGPGRAPAVRFQGQQEDQALGAAGPRDQGRERGSQQQWQGAGDPSQQAQAQGPRQQEQGLRDPSSAPPPPQDLAEAYAALVRLLEVKDKMIWHLLRERDELAGRLTDVQRVAAGEGSSMCSELTG